ncbi:2'-5' RNA ligase family protein [Thermomonospora echinospora]|nr:2'-5' RNA ligase family protein [Thermomonospora echinospora]
MRDHWWWRPGARPGRRMLLWHLLVDDQPDVRALAGRFRERLAGVGGLDPVPDEWLHLTTQIVGFADEIPRDEVKAMTSAVAESFRTLPPVTARIGRLYFYEEGVALGVEPERALDPVRDAIRRGVAQTVTAHQLDDQPDWTPHLSVAYCNTDGPAEPIFEALADPPEPCRLTVRWAYLVEQVRDGHLYRWDTVAAVPLTG